MKKQQIIFKQAPAKRGRKRPNTQKRPNSAKRDLMKTGRQKAWLQMLDMPCLESNIYVSHVPCFQRVYSSFSGRPADKGRVHECGGYRVDQ